MNWISLAQTATPIDGDGWAQLISAIASLGFAVWYAYHTTTKTIPEMQRTHAETITNMQTVHGKTVDEITEKHSVLTDRLLAEFRAETREQRAVSEKRAETSAELARSGHLAVNQITQAVGELRVAIQQSTMPPQVRKSAG